MTHLSEWVNPREKGLTPYNVAFTLAKSAPLRSMLEVGIVYRHPECRINAVVWAKDQASIADVLRYHYRERWSDLVVES